MFSFKNGILRIGQEKPGLDLFVDVGFFLLLCSQFSTPTTVNDGSNYFYYVAFFLLVGATFVKLITLFRTQGTFVLPTITIWFGSFTLLAFASLLWADYTEAGGRVISRLIQTLAITFCMAQNYTTRKNLLKCVRMFSWAGIYAFVYILANTPLERLFKGGFGGYATSLNPNTIGMIFTICVIVSFYFAFYCKENVYYIFTALQLFTVILTGSRKSLIATAGGIIMLILMKSNRRNIIWRIIIGLAFAATLFYLIMAVPELYKTIGVRIESMIEHIVSDGGDYSMSLRRLLIDNAKDMFYEKPIFGYGINNFVGHIGERIGIATYAHNNYCEILADLGIVGFFVYYSFYIYLIGSLLKVWFKSHGSLVKLMIVWIGVIMVCEYGLVSYYQVYIHVTICCAYLFICAYDSEDDFSGSTPSYLKYRNGVYN